MQVVCLLYYIKFNAVVRFIGNILRFIELSVLHREITPFTLLTKGLQKSEKYPICFDLYPGIELSVLLLCIAVQTKPKF